MTDPSIYRQLADLEERLRRLETAERAIPVYARASTNAGQIIPNATIPRTTVNFEDVSFDPLGCITVGAGWVFTAPIGGLYRVTAVLTYASTATWAPGEVADVALWHDGAEVSVMGYQDVFVAGTAVFARAQGSDEVECAAGETIQIRTLQSSGAPLALFNAGAYNYVTIARVG